MADKAIRKYLARRAAPEIELAARVRDRYGFALVVPACDEDASMLDGFAEAAANAGAPVLVIAVVNATEDADAAVHARNESLVRALETTQPGFDLLVIDRASPGRRLPGKGGVGLARKIGCDLALALIAAGAVASPWIHTTDADARLPADYFAAPARATDAVALSYPFFHDAAAETELCRAHLVYEISLRLHVLGLARAGSPYAFHTIGSAMAARADAYAAVRGMPARTGGEDFYLLQKLRKLGPVARADSAPISLACRHSARVPFGTGPAVARLLAGDDRLVPDPIAFDLLGDWLALLDAVAAARDPAVARDRVASWRASPGPHALLAAAAERSGALAALTGDHAGAPSAAAYRQRLHDAFDALRTLRLLHELAAAGLPDVPWSDALSRTPALAHLADLAGDLPRLTRALAALEP